MKKLILIVVSAAILLLSLEGTSLANDPFIRISTEPDEVVLSTIPGSSGTGRYSSLTVNVESNCTHGAIVVSITPLKMKGKLFTVPRERISVIAPTTSDFVPLSKSVTISKTQTGSHEIPLTFRVDASFDDYAGKYEGTIAFTVMPPA